MGRDDVIETLRRNQDTLKQMGVRHLHLFGSVARGESGNDVDLLADFDEGVSLVRVARIERTLAEMLGTEVDLVQEGTLKERVQERVAQELVRAF